MWKSLPKYKSRKNYLTISKQLRPCVLLAIIVLLTTAVAIAQANSKISVIIKGEITDINGVGVTDCTIKISSQNKHIIYSYFNLPNQNTFSTKITLSAADTLLVVISHIGYSDTIITCISAFTEKICEIYAILRFKVDNLQEVVVKTPPIWKRGDTTFYRTDAFAEGNEQRLKDLISKIPGFEITKDGRLLYEHKDVTKLLINGESLFEDKIKLLLDNLPIHKIKLIEAIENQKDNPLLKGMKGRNEVFVNLALIKKNGTITFGDAELGSGTANKYSLHTTLFPLLKKVQAGFIGNWDNIGNGVSWQEEDELKNNVQQFSEQWLMNSRILQIIPDFENRWYINNGQWDNRLQINLPLNKKLKSKTEVDFAKDRQLQNSYYVSSLYDGSIYKIRNDTNAITYKPSLVNAKQIYDWDIDSTKRLSIIAGFLYDFSGGKQYSIYTQNSDKSLLKSSINNDWKSFYAKTTYTHRTSKNKVDQLFIDFNFQNMHQIGLGISPNWPELFTINSAFNLLRQNLANRITDCSALWLRQKDRKNSSFNYGLSYQLSDIKIKSRSDFNNEQQDLLTYVPNDFNNKAAYQIHTFSTTFIGYKFIDSFSSISYNTNVGIAYTEDSELKKKEFFITPQYFLKADYRTRIAKILQSNLSISASQNQVESIQLYRFSKPTSISTYQSFDNIKLPLRSVQLSYNLGWNWPNSLSRTLVGCSYTNNFTSFASDISLNNFVSLNKDSLVKKNTGYFTIFTSQNLPTVFIMLVINLEAGYSNSGFLLSKSGQILKTTNSSSYCRINLKKNWNKKYHITLSSDFLYTHYKLPGSIEENISSNVVGHKSTLQQFININTNMNFSIKASLFNQNLFTQKNNSFVFLSTELNIKLKKLPLNFSLRGENLTNQKFYYNNINNYLYQSFYTIPLIPLRGFVSIKYNL